MKQISSFMSEISDEFKIVVVEAIRYGILAGYQRPQLWVSLARCTVPEAANENANVMFDMFLSGLFASSSQESI